VKKLARANAHVRRIAASGLSIYDPIEIGSDLWIPSDLLEALLQTKLAGHRFEAAALRTRSKLAKSEVCRVLGYPIPKSFRRTKPLARFPGQNLEIVVQAANTMAVYNEAISPSRRYVLIRPDSQGVIHRIRVLAGADLAPLDSTGKLTQKFQARISDLTQVRLASVKDTSNLANALAPGHVAAYNQSPIDHPESGTLLPIRDLFARISPLVGQKFGNPGILQERNRGGLLHGLVSEALGYSSHADNGTFPDIRHQLLEVKLQTSPTIDLGAISPDSDELLDCPAVGNIQIRHQDVRYAVFCGSVTEGQVTITGLVLVTGMEFYFTFVKFGGLVINNKYQLHLPRNFFDQNTEGIFD
jgi:hypothetical protein